MNWKSRERILSRWKQLWYIAGGVLSLFPFTTHAHRLTDKWMAAGVRERAGTSTLTGRQLKMPASASQPHVRLSPLSRERYYLWMPELFMHCKITPWVGQNETGAGVCDGYCIIFITSLAWAVAGKESNVKWDEHCQQFTLNCFNMLFFDSGHSSYTTAELWLSSIVLT